MKTVLLTGGSGFFGGLLKQRLLDDGYRCVNLDLLPDEAKHPNLVSIQGDIRDRALLERIFSEHSFDGILHIAAILAHGDIDEKDLWTSNVDGTRNLADMVKKCRGRLPKRNRRIPSKSTENRNSKAKKFFGNMPEIFIRSSSVVPQSSIADGSGCSPFCSNSCTRTRKSGWSVPAKTGTSLSTQVILRMRAFARWITTARIHSTSVPTT